MTNAQKPGPSPQDQAVSGPDDANAWLVEEMYEQYQSDPSSVSPTWQEFFVGYRSHGRPPATPAAPATAASSPAPAPTAAAPAAAPASSPGTAPAAAPTAGRAPAPAGPSAAPAASRPSADAGSSGEDGPAGDQIRGVGARIVANMELSLGVPTATSFREVPAKLLEVNRRIINGYLGRTRGGKVSFTHLIGYAVVRAIADHVPVMNNTYVEGPQGEPRLVRNAHVGLGLAVDIEKKDGSRSLVVPCIRDADTLDFAAFTAEYDDLIRKVKTNKLTVDDFAGVTVTLTNPGHDRDRAVRSAPDARPGHHHRRRHPRLSERFRRCRSAHHRRTRRVQGDDDLVHL